MILPQLLAEDGGEYGEGGVGESQESMILPQLLAEDGGEYGEGGVGESQESMILPQLLSDDSNSESAGSEKAARLSLARSSSMPVNRNTGDDATRKYILPASVIATSKLFTCLSDGVYVAHWGPDELPGLKAWVLVRVYVYVFVYMHLCSLSIYLSISVLFSFILRS
jgi:hypothetical protein